MCLLLQRECQKIGFNLEVKKVPTDGYWSAVWQQTPMHATAWNMRPTASIMLDMAYHPDAPWSDTFWKDERMRDLLNKVKGETNAKNRHALQCEMQTIVTENAPVVIPAHSSYLDAKSSKIQGVPKLPLGALGGGEWVEFAWLES
jgi:peptide/nickel transport system substrate-binding protein